MVVNLMSWERIRHVPVENNDHHLVGLSAIARCCGSSPNGGSMHDTPVSAIMKTDVLTVGVETRTLDGDPAAAQVPLRLLAGDPGRPPRRHPYRGGTSMNVASRLLEQQLGEAKP